MRIAIGSDHAGYALKSHLLGTLSALGHEVDDHGTDGEEPVDYPPICAAVGRAVASGKAQRGIVLGGSGQGEQIAANKIHGVRAALCHDLYTARMARLHNDANVLAIGGRIVAHGLAEEILRVWLDTGFEGGRHARRLAQITDIEAEEARGVSSADGLTGEARERRPSEDEEARGVSSADGLTGEARERRPSQPKEPR